jgi:predicted ester cyclase
MTSTPQTRLRLAMATLLVGATLCAAPALSKGQVALTPAQGRAIVAPLYDALNEPSKKDVVALLAKATNPDYRSCSTNQDCLNRTQLAGQFKFFGKVIPDLHWRVVDLWTSGNHIVVRGEATGTPAAPLFGVAPTGRSFRTISIDMFTVTNGKLSTAYHVENWEAATDQIKAR